MTETPKSTADLTNDELAFVNSLRDGKLPDAMRIFKKHHAIIEPEESKRAEPINHSAAGGMWAYGWHIDPELVVRTTNRDDLQNIPDEIAEFGVGVITKMDNFKLAFAIVAKLIEYGQIDVNFSNPTWYSTIEICVDGVAEILNRH